MKTIYAVGSAILTVIILIVAFQNFGTDFKGFMFFFAQIDVNGTIVVFGISLLGILAGGFYFGFLSNLLNAGNGEEEEGPGGNIQ
jgi:uncharacterized integral membrane protein